MAERCTVQRLCSRNHGPYRTASMEIVLYTRRGCHLCEAAEDLLAALLPGVTRIDVADDARLEPIWGARVPVLVVAGRVVAEGRFDETAVARAVNAVRGRD